MSRIQPLARALRLGFMYYESLLKPQIRSFLRLSKIFEIKILCPMITTPNDLIQVIDAIKQEQEELNLLGEEINEIPEIGIMVEVPNGNESFRFCFNRRLLFIWD